MKVFKSFGIGLIVGLVSVMLIMPGTALAAEKQKTLRIGYLLGLTGFAADSQIIYKRGVEILVDYLNKKGGVMIKGQKYPIEIVWADHKCTADGAVAGATKLIYDAKVKYIAGMTMPFIVAAAATVTEPAGVLRSVVYNCATPQEFSASTPFTFLARNGSVEGIITGLKYVSETRPDIKKIAVLIPDDGSIPNLAVQVKKWGKHYGGIKVVGDVIGWPLNTVDFTPFALKAIKRNPDAIVMVNGWPAMMGGILKAAREAGFKKPVFACNYTQAADVMKVAGKEASTNFWVHGINPGDPNLPPLLKMLLDEGKKRFGDDRITFLSEGANPVYCLVQAIEKAQSFDPKVIRKVWAGMDTIDTLFGTGWMGGKETYGLHQAVHHPIPIEALEGGEVKLKTWINKFDVP